MSNFNQSKTAARLFTRGDHSGLAAGLKIQHRSPDLRPRLRGNAGNTGKELNPVSSSFPTQIGLRQIPRQVTAARPDAAMIRNARRGIMSKFLRSGRIIRASDLGSMADPNSAIISLTDDIEMETDHLSDEEDPMPEREKSLENLYYICVQEDELPSYHFWRGKGDPDPINVHRPIDWHGIVDSDLPAVMEPAQVGDTEREATPANIQERLIRSNDPKGSCYEASEAPEIDEFYPTVEHKEERRKFLDFHDDESTGQSNLHRRKLELERVIHPELGEPSQQTGGHGGDKPNLQNVQMNLLALDSDTDTSTTNRRRAAQVRADGNLKKAGEDEKTGHIREGRQILTNPTSADELLKDGHFRSNSGLSPDSVYKKTSSRGIQLPRYMSTLDYEITGGPDMPTVYARVPTLSEIRILQRRVWRLENWVLQREDYCRVCDETFAYGAPDIEGHYRKHRLGLVCPYCQQDWREKTRQDQIAHLASSHQLEPPLAESSLKTADAPGSSYVPLMKEIVCTFNGCHAPLHQLTTDERSDHAEMHARMNQLSHPPNLCSFRGCHVNLNTLKERGREEHTLLHTLKHSTQAPTQERESSLPRNQAPPVNPVRTSLSAPPINPTPKKSPTKSPHDETSSPRAETAQKPIVSALERERDPHGRILRSPGQGWYCAVCYTNVTTLGLTKQKTHARSCKTTVHDLLALTKEEAAQFKKAANSGAAETAADNNSSQIETNVLSTPSRATRAQGKRRATGANAYRPEPADDSSSSVGEEKEERKRKSATGTKTQSSRKRPRNRNAAG